MRRLLSLLLCVASLLACSFALAQPAGNPVEPDRAKASAHFRRGVELYRQAAYPEALREFEQAYEAAPDFHVLFNVAESKVQTGDYVGGARAYYLYLEQGGEQIPAARRAQIEQTISRLAERIGGIVVQSDRERAEVLVDGVSFGATPLPEPIPSNVGSRVVVLRTPDGLTQERSVEVRGASVAHVHFEFGPVPPLALRVVHEPPRAEGPSRRIIAVIATGSAALATAVGSGVLAALAVRAQRDIEHSESRRMVDVDALRDDRTKRRRYVVSSAALAGAAGALGLTSALLYWLKRRERRHDHSAATTHARVEIGAKSLSLQLTF